MLAYVFDSSGKLMLKEMPDPTATVNTAVIKVKACSICGTDFRTYVQGSSKITPPRIIGHEVVGTITQVGKGVNGFYVGDRVAVAPAIGCGHCYPCSIERPNMCDRLQTIGFQFDGGFAEYMTIPEIAFAMNNVTKLNDLIDNEEAALAEPIACVVNAQEFLNITKGDYVAIWGSGFIGCMHAELAFRSGAEKVIMIELSPKRAEEAIRLVPGITMLNPKQVDTYSEIMRITDGRGVNVAITACSAGKAQEDALQAAAKRGRVSLFGGLVGESKGFVDSNMIHYKELSVCGVHASTPLQNKKVLNWISGGSLKVKKYITAVYALQDIQTAFEAIKNGDVLKAIVKP
jgi:L-iditol 2-dehydrogenase